MTVYDAGANAALRRGRTSSLLGGERGAFARSAIASKA